MLIDKLYETDKIYFTYATLISSSNLYNKERCEETAGVFKKLLEELEQSKEIPEEEKNIIRDYFEEGVIICERDRDMFNSGGRHYC